MPLLPFSREDLAALVFVFSLAYACGQFAAGALADRAGARTIVAGGMIVSAIASAAMAGARTLLVFACLQLVNGVAQSCGWPGLLKIAAATFDPARRGVVMAWWTTNYVVGGSVATFL